MELRVFVVSAALVSLSAAFIVSGHPGQIPLATADGVAGADTLIHVVSTTDLHGYLQAQSTPVGLSYGGLDVMAGYFANARQEDPDTVFLDSGDLFQGTLISNTSYGAPVVKWMNFAEYSAAAVGNHEFDYGPGNAHGGILAPGEDPLGALKAREAEAHFPFLSANICSLDEDAGQCQEPATFKPASFVQPYLLKTVKGVRLGIIGLTTVSTPETTLPANVARLRFMPLRETLERFVPELKTRGADVILLVAHEGGFCDHGSCNAGDPIFQLLDELKPETRREIPLVLAGHTHDYVNTVRDGVRVMITGSYGRSFGFSTLAFHPTDRTTTVVAAQSVDFCAKVFPDTRSCYRGSGAPIAPDFLGRPVTPVKAANDLIASDVAAADATAARVVGRLVTAVPRTLGAAPESPLGDLMADAYRSCLDPSCNTPADIAFQNNGGIRSAGLPAGPVTYGEIFELMPFDNFHADLLLKGSQVHDLLDGWFAYSGGKRLNTQVSGFQLTYDPSARRTRSITNSTGETRRLADPIVEIRMADGTPFDESRVYRVVMADFLATGGGGSGFVLKGIPAEIHHDRELRDEIVDYLKSHPEGLDYGSDSSRLVVRKSS